MISSIIASRRHSKNNQHDLFAELSQIISAHDMHVRMLLANNVDVDAEYSALNSLNSPKSLPKSEYRRSPLGQDHMPTEQPPPKAAKIEQEQESFKYRKYKNNSEVKNQCQRLLQFTAYPTVAQVTALVHRITQIDPNTMEINEIKSTVLHWFRKRREYLASKVYAVCDDLMGVIWTQAVENLRAAGVPQITYDLVVEEIVCDTILMAEIVKSAKLPVKDETNALNFVRKKVRDYFTKLCSKTIQ